MADLDSDRVGANSSILFMALSDPSRLARASRMLQMLGGFGLPVNALCVPPAQESPIQVVAPVRSDLLGVSDKRLRLIARKAAYAIGVHQPSTRLFESAVKFRYGVGRYLDHLTATQPRLIVTEDVELLPLALEIKARTGAKVLIDVRDFKWDTGGISLRVLHRDHWVYQHRLFKTWLTRADTVLAVSEGQSVQMRHALGVEPVVIRSTPQFSDLTPQSSGSQRLRLIYHGKADRERQLELIIKAIGPMSSIAQLDLVIAQHQSGYMSELKSLAEKYDNIRFLQPVASQELVEFANSYDLGIIFYPPANANIASALPNKFFELIQSRLGVVVGPEGDMAELVRNYGCGFVTDGYTVSDLVTCLSGITSQDLDDVKARAHFAAQDLCFEVEREKLSAVLTELRIP